MYKFEIGKLYYVNWLDHMGHSGWINEGTIGVDENDLCTTVGFCSAVSEQVVQLSASKAFQDPSDVQHYNSSMCIYHALITDAWEVVLLRG